MARTTSATEATSASSLSFNKRVLDGKDYIGYGSYFSITV